VTRLGAEDAYVIGGQPSVSATTFASLETALSGDTTRVAGPDRYRTAAAVAALVHDIAGTPPRVFLASGQTFADALAAGPLAFASASPILYATSTGVPQVTRDAVASIGATHTVILGRSASVFAGAEALLPGATRIGGGDRFRTSAQFATWAVTEGLLDPSRPVLATGLDFPDGLASAPFAALRQAPLLLTRRDALPDQVSYFLDGHAAALRRVTVLGGPRTIGDQVVYGAAEKPWIPQE
jgi:putative cell wall-binding protein